VTAPIIAYCLDWHMGQSRAFEELLVEPLKPFVDIMLTAWDGQSSIPLDDSENPALNRPLIFCQRPPTPDLLKDPEARLVWIPMWDNVALNWSSDEWWASLPKSLRIIALSDGVARMAGDAGLPTLNLRYHQNPLKFDPVNWKNGRTLFYWNRTGLFGSTFIEKLCEVLDVQDFYFRGTLDPKISTGAAYQLPAKLGKTAVHQVSRFDSQKDYFELLRHCNIYLAPRALEGVGLTFLEAMAAGCAVMGYDAPTMNEYIEHGVDGFLFSNVIVKQEGTSFAHRAKNTIRKWALGAESASNPYRASEIQDWGQLEKMDLEGMGLAARAKQAAGFSLWEEKIPEYADFILNW
jgi:hypothetical protein